MCLHPLEQLSSQFKAGCLIENGLARLKGPSSVLALAVFVNVQHSLTSLLPLTDITLTDSWYHHHHHYNHYHWLFPALSLGQARYVNFNRIIPGITGGMLLQRLSRSTGLLPVPSPVLPRTIFCFGQKKLDIGSIVNVLEFVWKSVIKYHWYIIFSSGEILLRRDIENFLLYARNSKPPNISIPSAENYLTIQDLPQNPTVFTAFSSDKPATVKIAFRLNWISIRAI